MNTIAEFMTAHHKACDHQFADAEAAVLDGNWNSAASAFKAFEADMQRHFRNEEELLFPALSAANGPAGPMQVMRMEHEQIVELLRQMAEALAALQAQKYAGLSETLLMVMQQHNHKEENMLYPMMDHFLASERQALLDRLQAA